jgi:hypothetical protein
MIECPIWKTRAYRIKGYELRDGTAVDSPRAGGKYFISRQAEINLRNLPDDMRVKITHEIVDHNAVGSIPEILTTTIEGLYHTARAKPADRAKRLLRCLVRQSGFLEQEISGHRMASFWENNGNFGSHYSSKPEGGPMFAWSDSVEDSEVNFLLRMLAEDRAVELDDQAGIPNIVVLPKGYDLASEATGEGSSDQAFVAMWFDASMSGAYEFGIEAAVRECGYRPLRIDQKEHVNKIDDEIIGEIRRSRFIVADFTSEKDKPRGGVYFEAGYALALGKPVIWCCRQDMINSVHFDTRQFNHIVWSEPVELRTKLKNRIGAILGDGPFRQ